MLRPDVTLPIIYPKSALPIMGLQQKHAKKLSVRVFAECRCDFAYQESVYSDSVCI
jgi:hypothetical protein